MVPSMELREHAPTKPDDRAGLARVSAESRGFIVLGVLLIAANLRAPFTGLPPVLGLIREDFALSTAAASALTTLPLLAFALVSPISALLAREYGLERTLFGALVSIALGIALRSAGAPWCLYLGTCIIGMGIAVGNVLLPSLVKRDFPSNVAAITGAYALAMGVAAALGSAVAIPLAHSWGWRGALATSLVFPLLALGVWSARVRARTAPARDTAAPLHGGKIWHSALAWQVTLFLGLNSTIYYVAIGWLPAILVDAGVSPATAGSMHGLMQLATAVPGLLLGPIVTRMSDQRLPAAVVAALSAIALLGLLAAPRYAALWAVLFGLGTGAGIILGLTFVSLRTSTAHQAATLSGMAQSIGYLLAAVGPIAVGALHDAMGGWGVSLGLCTAVALLAAVMGVLAGRSRYIDNPTEHRA